MPFLSKSQERACWARYKQRLLSGKKIDWDCIEWRRQTNYKNLPEKIPNSKSKKKSIKKISKKSIVNSLKKKGVKIYSGKRGGKYIVKSGYKIYI